MKIQSEKTAVAAPADMGRGSAATAKVSATERAISSLVKAVGKDANTEAKAEAARRKAVGDTFLDWITGQDEATQREVFAGLEIAASKTNRNRIASYVCRPEGVDAIVEKALEDSKQEKTKSGSDDKPGPDQH